MSTSKDSGEEQDPDYATPGPSDSLQQKQFEETARTNASRKITAIIEKEFSKEIDTKEKEILLIQNRLQNALKTLHFLRYVIITDFYNRKQCVVQPPVDSKQTRIHPAIKQVIGKAPKSTENVSSLSLSLPSTSRGPSQLLAEVKSPQETSKGDSEAANHLAEMISSQKEAEEKPQVSEKRSLEGNECSGPPKKIPRYVPPKSGVPEPQAPSRGVRHKVRKRIIIGNMSKWIPPDWREDKASHKWTMYVRGSKENPDISDFVGKIRFFLDPSYRPNDVVEVTGPPFHLTRRGWGEFCLRVQIHFKNPATKPMNFYHNLKLDRTYTGLQTLGSETVADVWIYTFDCPDEKPEIPSQLEPANGVKEEEKKPVMIKEEKNHCHVYNDHDYTNFYRVNNQMTGLGDNNITIIHSPPERIEKKKSLAEGNPSLVNGDLQKAESISKATKNVPIIKKECISTDEKSSAVLENGVNALKLPNGNLDSLKMNSQPLSKSIDPRTLASTLDHSSSKFQPLKINIPSTFSSLRATTRAPVSPAKQVLLLKNNKVIPVNLSNPKSDDKHKHENGKSSQMKIIRLNSKSSKAGVSLLKKSNNILLTSKTNSLLNIKLDPSKSLFLEAESNVPALQIADPMAVQCPGVSRTNGNHENLETTNAEYILRTLKSKIALCRDKIKLPGKKEEYEKILKAIEEVKITDTEALLRFIVKRLPLITKEVSDFEYRKLHPYACSNEKDFLNYNVGKQRALEWYRAKTIRSFLKKKNLAEEEVWSTKEIMMWCRVHGHTPVRFPVPSFRSQTSITSKTSDKTPGDSSDSFSNTHTEALALLELQKDSTKVKECQNDEIIDIEGLGDDSEDKIANKASGEYQGSDLEYLEIPESILGLHSFVTETSRQIGVKFGPEEIEPGVIHCAAGNVMVKAVQCLMEDLLRSSLAKAWERSSDGSSAHSITIKDVFGVIADREELDFVTHSGLGSQQFNDD